MVLDPHGQPNHPIRCIFDWSHLFFEPIGNNRPLTLAGTNQLQTSGDDREFIEEILRQGIACIGGVIHADPLFPSVPSRDRPRAAGSWNDEEGCGDERGNKPTRRGAAARGTGTPMMPITVGFRLGSDARRSGRRRDEPASSGRLSGPGCVRGSSSPPSVVG
jgi:hypothetical protein